MHEDSPFNLFEKPKPIAPSRIMYVLFCMVCHYVWKAPGETKQCMNCKGNGDSVTTLAKYQTEHPIT